MDLEQKLEHVKTKIVTLEKRQHSSEDEALSKTFHLGMVGRSGKQSARLNARKLDRLDTTIDRAVELTALYEERDSLLQSIHREVEAPQRQQIQQQKQQSLEVRIKSAQPGDEIVTWTGTTVTIARVNSKSVTTISGSRYLFSEITGVIRKR